MNTKTKVILAFTVIFLLGFTTGFLFNHVVPVTESTQVEEKNEKNGQWQQYSDKDREERERRAQRWLTNQLDLTEEQQDEFFDKFGNYHSDIRGLVREQRGQEHELIKNLYFDFRTEISSILEDEQIKILDSHFHPDSVQFGRQRSQQQRRGRN